MICGIEEDTAQAIIDAAVEHIEGVDDEDTITPARLPSPGSAFPVPGPLRTDIKSGTDAISEEEE